ncbi:MAG: NUDIX hydrolase [Hyphomicrobiaceae bacterium]|nr:NUDIX hydrolase [Hyphomicrobiaceae bacterium]
MTKTETRLVPQWPRAAASAVVFRGDEVLLVERGKSAPRGLWSLPGGHIEPGEKARDAAKREVMEETAMAAELKGLVDVHDVIFRKSDGSLAAHYVLAVYWGWTHDGHDPVRGDDARDARFYRFDEIASLNLTDGTAEFVERARALRG